MSEPERPRNIKRQGGLDCKKDNHNTEHINSIGPRMKHGEVRLRRFRLYSENLSGHSPSIRVRKVNNLRSFRTHRCGKKSTGKPSIERPGVCSSGQEEGARRALR
ncbi:hypothetical protein CISG_02022 [Coccidioides immitis RMSCC 3703]|uniref:Uncharacterized protein n=1 Tax=Coccidioides immitis RMSCC 3703 TaxID=454286 RepID=A0A0J8R372_COCIT|nr:hypothetical protein CISG_02022 [Coccidioides immitis RMSCC 3703]